MPTKSLRRSVFPRLCQFGDLALHRVLLLAFSAGSALAQEADSPASPALTPSATPESEPTPGVARPPEKPADAPGAPPADSTLPEVMPPATGELPFPAEASPLSPDATNPLRTLDGSILPYPAGELPFPDNYPLALPDPSMTGEPPIAGEQPLETANPDLSGTQNDNTAELFSSFANRWQPLLASPDGTPLLGMNSTPAGGGFFQNPLAAVWTPSLPDGTRSRIGLGTSLSGVYSSNPTMGYTGNGIGPSDSGEGDFSMTLGGNLSYGSGNSNWTYNVAYSGGYSHSFNLSELGGYSQSAAASISRDGGRWNGTLGLNLSIGSGANRQYQAVVDETTLGISLGGSYQVSPKTSITGSLGTGLSIADGGNPRGSKDAGSLTGNIAAMWRYSPLLQFGPGIRLSQESGDNGQDRTSIGPTINANYRLSRKISVNAQVGLDFAQYDGGSSDPSLTTSIGATYAMSRLWSMNASLGRNTQADMSGTGGFNESTSINFAVQRRIRKASLSASLSYGLDEALSATGTGTSGNNRENLGFTSSLSMPIFAGRASASTFFSIQDQSGNSSSDTPNLSVGFSISHSF